MDYHTVKLLKWLDVQQVLQKHMVDVLALSLQKQLNGRVNVILRVAVSDYVLNVNKY